MSVVSGVAPGTRYFRAGDDDADVAPALPAEPGALLVADPLGLAAGDERLEQRVREFDSLLGKLRRAEVAPSGRRGAALRAFGARPADRRSLRFLELAGELPVELRELRHLPREFQLELLGVHALGLGDEDPLPEELQLEAQTLV
jgi:hypothetical protein